MNIIKSLSEYSIIKAKHEKDLSRIEVMTTENDFQFYMIMEVLKHREWDLNHDPNHYLKNRDVVDRFLSEQYSYIQAINEGSLKFETMSLLDRRNTVYSFYQSGLLPERMLHFI